MKDNLTTNVPDEAQSPAFLVGAVSNRFNSEMDLITSRINLAVILAKEHKAKGIDLKPIMQKLIEEENYSGAEGIRRVLENEC